MYPSLSKPKQYFTLTYLGDTFMFLWPSNEHIKHVPQFLRVRTISRGHLNGKMQASRSCNDNITKSICHGPLEESVPKLDEIHVNGKNSQSSQKNWDCSWGYATVTADKFQVLLKQPPHWASWLQRLPWDSNEQSEIEMPACRMLQEEFVNHLGFFNHARLAMVGL